MPSASPAATRGIEKGSALRGLRPSVVGLGRAALAGVVMSLVVAAAPASAAVGWTGPTRIGDADSCEGVDAALDPSGKLHIVSLCGDKIRYSTNRSGAWTTKYFGHPAGTSDQVPKVAVDDDRVYIAFNRVMLGGKGEPSGPLLYRWRTLDGTWSAPDHLGDLLGSGHIQDFAFRVAGGVIHVVTLNISGIRYTTNESGPFVTYLVDAPAHVVPVVFSLQIGSDDRPRIAFERWVLEDKDPVYEGLFYARWTGAKIPFTLQHVPDTTVGDIHPSMVLDAANHPSVAWFHNGAAAAAVRPATHRPPSCCLQSGGSIRVTTPRGATGPAGPATSETRFATRVGGSWTAIPDRHLSNFTGDLTLAINGSGQLRAVISNFEGDPVGVRYYRRSAGGDWTSQNLSNASTRDATFVIDPLTGHSSVVSARGVADANGSLYLMTKP